MEEKKKNSASWMLAKINLGIFVLFILPSTLYATYIARSSKIWSSKFPAFFLEVFTLPLVALAAIGTLFSIIGIIYRKKNSLISFIIHFLLVIIYISIVSGKLIHFLIH